MLMQSTPCSLTWATFDMCLLMGQACTLTMLNGALMQLSVIVPSLQIIQASFDRVYAYISQPEQRLKPAPKHSIRMSDKALRS